MDAYQQVKDKLEELGIEFEVVEHPPAFTTEQADSYIEGLEGVRTKSMFLTNKKKTQFYLLIMDDKKPLDMDDFKEQVEANRIRMASAESLAEKNAITSWDSISLWLVKQCRKKIFSSILIRPLCQRKS